MKNRHSKNGFVLVFSIVVLGAAAVILSGVFSYISFTTRATMTNIAKSDCRLAAQSVIDRAKIGIDIAFQTYTGQSAGVRIGPRSGDAYDWFETFSDGVTIGKGTLSKGTAYRLPMTPGFQSTNVNGCVVFPRFGGFIRDGNSSWADVLILATASLTTNGVTAEVTIEERVRFATERSKVFDYAYFVNNYGWFNGSGCTANGDVRANGNLELGDCIINGEAWAAINPELGVKGDMSKAGKFESLSTYWKNAGNSMIRPSSPTSTGGSNWAGGYEVPSSAWDRCHPNQETGITMPWIGDLQNEYVPYARELNGSLSGGQRYYMESEGNKAVVKSKANTLINAHYNGAGPSGNPTLADRGSIVLVGTDSNPIRIDGPVVFDGDVIIKGTITGQGTIYSGRNIHIIGNLKYKDPPSWPHPDTNPEATRAKNATKDLVGLAAKGNIAIGNAADANWLNSIKSYISSKPYVQPYECDSTDADIGYKGTFGGSYAALDGLKKINYKEETKVADRQYYQNKETLALFTEAPSDYNKYITKNKWGSVTGNTKYNIIDPGKSYKTGLTMPYDATGICHYYDTVCYNSLISSLAESAVTRIDGILYNNHGIFGKIGNCVFNGALICRNEGLIYSSSLKINWDIRLRSGSAEGLSNNMGLPVGASQPCTVAWHETSLDYFSATTNGVPGRVTY